MDLPSCSKPRGQTFGASAVFWTHQSVDEDHPCRQCLDVHGCVAFSSAEAAWSHSPVTFPLLQLGSANLVAFGSPEPAPYSQLVPSSAREPQPSSSQARPGTLMGEAWLCQHTSDTCATCLPLLPAWDVTDCRESFQQ